MFYTVVAAASAPAHHTSAAAVYLVPSTAGLPLVALVVRVVAAVG